MSRLDGPDSNSRGKEAERYAAEYLRREGYRVRETNVRYRGGEIDIVAEDGNTLVFVEVRARQSSPFGTAVESIDPRKQHRIYRAAEMYLQRHEADQVRSSRIDVVAIRLDRRGLPVSVELIRNALG